MLRGTGIILLIALTVVAALVAIAACGGDAGEGSVRVWNGYTDGCVRRTRYAKAPLPGVPCPAR